MRTWRPTEEQPKIPSAVRTMMARGLVIIRNTEFARHMHALFDHNILFAHCITLRQWRRRPILDRLTQWAVMRARYLL